VLLEVADVLHAAGGKIVEQKHLVALPEQMFGQMRTDETRTAGNQKAQMDAPSAARFDPHTPGSQLRKCSSHRAKEQTRIAQSDGCGYVLLSRKLPMSRASVPEQK
jgi:hypothetical protein